MPVKELIKTINYYLRDVHPGGSSLTIVLEGIRQEENWWYVPIKPDVQPSKTFEYYEALAQVEVKLLIDKDVTVVFKPVYNDSWVAE